MPNILVLVAVALVSPAAWSSAPLSALIDYRSDLGCPSRDEFVSYIEGHVDPRRLVDPARFIVRIRRSAHGFSGVLKVVHGDGGRPSVREVVEERCDRTAVALAIFVQLALTPSEEAPGDPGAQDPGRPHPVVAPPSSNPSSQSPPRLRVEPALSFSALSVAGPAPSQLWGGRLRARERFDAGGGPLSFAARVSFDVGEARAPLEPSGSATFLYRSALVGMCASARFAPWLALCADVGVAALSATADLPRNTRPTVRWPLVASSANIEIPLFLRVSLSLEAGLGFPWRRYEFVLTQPSRRVYTTGGLTGFMALGATITFP